MKPKGYENLLEAFWDQTRIRPSSPALYRKKNSRWESLSWTEAASKVAQLANAFKRSGLQPGDRVAIFSDNCAEWVISDFACMATSLVSVPLYPSLTEQQTRYIIEHSGATIAIVRGIDRLKKLLPIPSLKRIIVIDVIPQNETTIAFNKFIDKESADIETYRAQAHNIPLSSLATVVYTSGTTAEPKGVMLTHGNIISQSKMLAGRTPRQPDDVIISYLPLSHITERVNVFRQAITGYPLYFSSGIDSILTDIKEIRPTSLVAVPRIWEKLQDLATTLVNNVGPLQKKLLVRALEAGEKDLNDRRGHRINPKSHVRSLVFQRLLGPWVRHLLGLERCRLFVSGAAPLDRHTLIFFYSLGMPMVEAYGMTECCGACHMNFANAPAFGTVGPVIDGMECKLADDGEILLRGSNVFDGYYKDEDQTFRATHDGWLHTGDIGTLDENGNLTITDRKKNVIITSGGKNIAPAPLESKIRKHPYISQAVVVGDRRKYLTLLVTLNAGLEPTLCEIEIERYIQEINSTLPSFERIKYFRILTKEFSIEGGELTPTLKVRKTFILEKYKSLIDEMYPAPGILREHFLAAE